MKRIYNIPLFFIIVLFLTSFTLPDTHRENWVLVWEEQFNDQELDSEYWTRIPRGTSDWNNYMSSDDRCYEMRNGHLVLKGIVNPDLVSDTAVFITGGVWTKDKITFKNGRVEIRAKLGEAQGAWPAFWMLPQGKKWPHGGEIDIMEHLNFDDFTYQTIHSNYTFNLGIKDNPVHYATGAINRNDFNIYAVEMYKDSLCFFVNDKKTFTYPRIETDKKGQFPFEDNFYLLLDMQLGGSWVGQVNPEQLPVEMEIDWVRFYKRKQE